MDNQRKFLLDLAKKNNVGEKEVENKFDYYIRNSIYV